MFDKEYQYYTSMDIKTANGDKSIFGFLRDRLELRQENLKLSYVKTDDVTKYLGIIQKNCDILSTIIECDSKQNLQPSDSKGEPMSNVHICLFGNAYLLPMSISKLENNYWASGDFYTEQEKNDFNSSYIRNAIFEFTRFSNNPGFGICFENKLKVPKKIVPRYIPELREILIEPIDMQK